MQRCDVVALITEISSEGWRESVTGTEESNGAAKGGFVSHGVSGHKRWTKENLLSFRRGGGR